MIAIKSNRTVLPGSIEPAIILIQNGKIVDIVKEIAAGIELIDVGNDVLMPGIIDPHVHINEPGRTSWEGFDTATKAALAGGICSLVDMPLNSSPVTTTAKAFDEKISATKDQLHVNCGFWGGVIPGNEDELEPLIEKGVLGFKAFLVHSGIDEFPNVTETDLRKAMPIIAKYQLPLLVHCELATNTKPYTLNPKHYKDYLQSRPKSWENDAIALMIRLCKEFNCRTHVVHLSSAESIEQIASAKQQGLPLTAETGQHYLYFKAEEIPDGHPEYKCAPPIREESNNEKLWAALKEGIIDFVATDHSPTPPGLKELATGNFMKAWGGISSLQFALPVLWTEAKKRECSLRDISNWLCYKTSSLPGLGNKKGNIAKGYDADLVTWDPEQSFTVTAGMIHHKHKLTPYLDEELYGLVKQTWIAGEKCFENGKFLHLDKGRILYH